MNARPRISPFLQAVIAGSLVAALFAGMREGQRVLNGLPVLQAGAAPALATGLSVSKLYPVLVKATAHDAASNPDADALASAFAQPRPVVPVASVAPASAVDSARDVGETIRHSVRLTGLTSGGAFIGGRFVAVGAAIYPSVAGADGARPRATLIAVSPAAGTATLDVDGRPIVLAAQTKDDACADGSPSRGCGQ